MTVPVKIQYKWSADELVKGLRVHSRYNSGAIRFIPYLGGFMVFGFFFMTLMGKQDFISNLALAVLGAFFLFINYFTRWQFRRRFQKNPNKDAQVTWIFTDEKFYSEGDGFDFSLAWRKVFQLIDSSKGFLIYPQKNLFYWIPFSGFANESEIDWVRQIAKSKAITYKKVG